MIINIRRVILFLSIFSLSAFFIEFNVLTVGVSNINTGYLACGISFLAAAILFVVAKRKKRLNIKYVIIFCAMSVSAVLYQASFFDYSLRSVLIFIPFMSFFTGWFLFSELNCEERNRVYAISLYVFLAAILIRNLWYVGFIFQIYSRYSMFNNFNPFLATGGRNLEVTFLSILVLLNVKNKIFPFAVFVLGVTSALFLSRIGFIGFLLSIFAYMKAKDKGFIFLFLPIVLILSLLTFGDQLLEVVSRFGIRQELVYYDSGVGRLSLWSDALDVLKNKYWGVGVGNAALYLNQNFYAGFKEDNIHNIYLTYFVEMGILFGFLFNMVIFKTYLVCIISKLDEIWMMSFLIICGAVEMTGYNTYFWFLIGAVYGVSTVKKRVISS
jgi:hypothetical protein